MPRSIGGLEAALRTVKTMLGNRAAHPQTNSVPTGRLLDLVTLPLAGASPTSPPTPPASPSPPAD